MSLTSPLLSPGDILTEFFIISKIIGMVIAKTYSVIYCTERHTLALGFHFRLAGFDIIDKLEEWSNKTEDA